MPHIYQKRPNTRLQIIQLAAKLFTEEGYSNTSFSKIAKILDLSTGNITFYFKSKEYLLAQLVVELLAFQDLMIEQATDEGKSSLLAYCLELTSIVAICEENEPIRDFFTASYTSPITLSLIRENDTQKTKDVFGQFRPDWTDAQWAATENVVSGIEYATIMTREVDTPLPMQIERTLNTIMLLYGVPPELRKAKIEKVLAMDYRALGRRILAEFKEYIKKVNEQNLKHAVQKNKK